MNRIQTLTGACALVGLCLAVGARPARAQDYSMSVTPWAGVYVPTRNTFRTVGTDIRRSNSFITGARFTGWGTGPIGVELAFGYAPAHVRVVGATINEDRATQVLVTGLKLMVGVSPASSSVGVFIQGGPALIRRGQDVTNDNRSVTDWGGVAGLGVRIPFSRAVGLRLDGEDYFYGGNFDGSRKFQNDLVLDAGLSIGL